MRGYIDKKLLKFYPLGNCVLRCPTTGVHAGVTPTLSLGERGL